MNGYSITFIPKSWRLGRFDIRKKTLWAFGPLRFGLHRDLKNAQLELPLSVKNGQK